MLMGKQMLLAILIIAVALGAKTEFQRGVRLLRLTADRTFMLRDTGTGIASDLTLKLCAAFHLFRRQMMLYPKVKEQEV